MCARSRHDLDSLRPSSEEAKEIVILAVDVATDLQGRLETRVESRIFCWPPAPGEGTGLRRWSAPANVSLRTVLFIRSNSSITSLRAIPYMQDIMTYNDIDTYCVFDARSPDCCAKALHLPLRDLHQLPRLSSPLFALGTWPGLLLPQGTCQ